MSRLLSRCRVLAVLAVLAVMAAGFTAATSLGAGSDPAWAAPNDNRPGRVTFALTEATGPQHARSFDLELRCADQAAAQARVGKPGPASVVRPHRGGGAECTVTMGADPLDDRVDEVTITVRQGDHVWSRDTAYSHDGAAESDSFTMPSGESRVELAVRSVPADEVGTPVRMMAFNIWHAGRLSTQASDEVRDRNLQQLVEYVSVEDPDVLFLVETYGSGEAVVDGLNATRPAGEQYTGVQVTVDPDLGGTYTGDNLWLITKLDVEEVYPRMGGGDLTSFNFGGARLGLPDGSHVHAFSVWLHHTEYAWTMLNQSVIENTVGLDRTYSDETVVDTDELRRRGMATTLLTDRLRSYVGEDDAPVLIGGDLNTHSHLDWSEQFADAPGHGGLVLPWRVTSMFEQAGFVDTYRHANPDAGRYPGRTWSPYGGWGYAPGRIDYLYARGDVSVIGAHTQSERLDEHADDFSDPVLCHPSLTVPRCPASDVFPFYSDHGAVVSDVVIRGTGNGPDADWTPTRDEPADTSGPSWPEPPPGTPVPNEELTATASTHQAGSGVPSRAVDGDSRTHWHSEYSPAYTAQPHEITVDMQRVRTLSAVRYQPRVVGNMNGTFLRATVQVSVDGAEFADVEEVRWERTGVPKNVDLSGHEARYVRFRVDYGVGGHASAAQIIPYER